MTMAAKVYGEPVIELPHDLYIPPDALEIVLEAFEGPLDLLLYLIRKENLDIMDIQMAPLTRQYMEYVEAMRTTNLELAAEYLVMAAMLMEIKSRLLLPRPPSATPIEDDPRAELVRRLLEYERMKAGSQAIEAMPHASRDFEIVRVWFDRVSTQRFANVEPDDLRVAWAGLVQRAKINRHHLVTREQLSVRAEMSRILKRLAGGRYAEFTTLFADHADVPHLVVTFLALLELAREQLVDLAQAEAYAPIHVHAKGEAPFSLAADAT
jgi:segregation and condensation protein A